MLRKFALGLVAAGALGIAALAPTSASAWQDRPHYGRHDDDFRIHRDRHNHDFGRHSGWYNHGFGMQRGWHGARAQFHHRGCIQQRLVPTPWGPRYRTINVCRY